MPIHSVSYDLRAPGRNYDALYDLLKTGDAWYRVTESHWLVATADNAATVRDKIRARVDANDAIFVVTISTPTSWSSFGIADATNEWVRQHVGWPDRP